MKYLAFILSLSLIAAFTHADDNYLALEHATVIDGTDNPPLKNHTVLIQADRIVAVQPSESLQLPENTERLNLQDKFIVPGYIDTHVHSVWGHVYTETNDGIPALHLETDADVSRQLLAPLLSAGITTIRNPGGPAKHTLKQRAMIEAGELSAPTLYTAGEVIDLFDGPGLTTGVKTPAAIKAEVNRQADAGVNMVKFYAGLNPTLLQAGIEQAQQRDLKTIGHLFATDWKTAAELGIDTIVHALPSSPVLLPPEQRAAFMQGITGTQYLFQWFQYADYNFAGFTDTIKAMAANDVNFDPTLVAVEGMFFADQEHVHNHPHQALVPKLMRDDWHGSAGLTADWSDEDYRQAQAIWPKVLELVKLMHEGGVMLTAGTDVANPNVIPGHGFHRELQLLSDAGIANSKILRIATLNGAKAIGCDLDTGSIETGKLADLVVLNSDPLLDIEHTRDIAAVYQAGKAVVTRP